jgi:Ras GTPase-activating protein 1
VARRGGAAAGSLLLLLFPPPGEREGERAWVGRLGARAWWPPGLPGGQGRQSRAGFNMMAAEAGSEDGPVTAGAGGGAAAGSSAYPAVCRVKIPVAAAPYPGLVEVGVTGTVGGGTALGTGFLGAGSALTGGGAAAGVAGAATGPAGDMALAKGTVSSSAETLGPGGGFPPLPPPPQLPPLGAGLGAVDEGDSLDGPEYEEEEVAIPLTAPPTNQ